MPILCCIDRYKRAVRGRGFLEKFETCSFDSDKLLACRPTPRMEEHHLFALRGYLFNVFLFTLHYMKERSFTCKENATSFCDKGPNNSNNYINNKNKAVAQEKM